MSTWEPEDIITRYERLLDASTGRFDDALKRYARAMLLGESDGKPTEEIIRLLQQTMELADLQARESVIRQAAGATQRRDVPNGMVPKVEYKDAVADILTRTPVLEQTYKDVQRAYQRDRVVAFARSSTDEVTKEVRRVLAEAQATGKPMRDVKTAIAGIGGWTKNYAETVYRTNMATAHSSGQWAMASDPAVAAVAPAFEFLSAKKATTRHNHLCAHGLIAATTDAIWHRFTPPLGYCCFCSIRLVFLPELRRRGLLDAFGKVIRWEPPNFADAFPDPGFGVDNPTVAMYQETLR